MALSWPVTSTSLWPGLAAGSGAGRQNDQVVVDLDGYAVGVDGVVRMDVMDVMDVVDGVHWKFYPAGPQEDSAAHGFAAASPGWRPLRDYASRWLMCRSWCLRALPSQPSVNTAPAGGGSATMVTVPVRRRAR